MTALCTHFKPNDLYTKKDSFISHIRGDSQMAKNSTAKSFVKKPKIELHRIAHYTFFVGLLIAITIVYLTTKYNFRFNIK